MDRRGKIKGFAVGFAVLFAVTAGVALAADPTDPTFGTNGIAEIEARIPATGQVGGIVDLEPTKGGKMLAAVYPIARGGHYFAAARIDPNGALDRSFGKDGFTPYIDVSHRKGEASGGVVQAEAVAEQKDGDILLAGYYDNERALAPALARFGPDGRLDPTFGDGGEVVPHPSNQGRALLPGETGGEKLHDVAIEPRGGDIVGVGEVVPGRPGFDPRSPGRSAALVVAWRPDGRLDRRFGHDGRFEVKARRNPAFTGFTQVQALPSGKLLVSGYVRQQIVLYRLTARGRIDRSFGGGDGRVTVGRPTSDDAYNFIRAPFAVDRKGRIVLCGGTFPSSGHSEEPVALVRLRPDGRRDRSFGRSIYIERAPADEAEPFHRRHVQFFHFQPEAVAVDGHARIVVTGSEAGIYSRGPKEGGFEYLYFSSRRFLPNGRRDRNFGHGGVAATNPPGSRSLARAALTQPDGRVVAGGWIQIERGGGNGPGNTAMLLTRYR
jgi:uncharacterized delta-60 repeat protein